MGSGRKEITQQNFEERWSGDRKGSLGRTDCHIETLGLVLGLLERENLTFPARIKTEEVAGS